MADSDQAAILEYMKEGEYFLALGIKPDASRIEIDIAAARLSATYPQLARQLTSVSSVIAEPTSREIYDIACWARDNVVDHRLGSDFRRSVPECRSFAWTEIQRVMRCKFELGEIKIEPRAARSIAEHEEWIRESIVNALLLAIQVTEQEVRFGNARRLIIFNQNCQACNGMGNIECNCREEYDLYIPSGAEAGTVLSGRGIRSGKIYYFLLDRKVTLGRPYAVLDAFYRQYEVSQKLRTDPLTFEEMKSQLKYSVPIMGIVLVLIGGGIGYLAGSWLMGMLTGLPLAVGLCLLHRFYHHIYYRRKPRRGTIALRVTVLLATQPIVGGAAGYFLSSVTSGLITGLLMSGIVIGLVVWSAKLMK